MLIAVVTFGAEIALVDRIVVVGFDAAGVMMTAGLSEVLPVACAVLLGSCGGEGLLVPTILQRESVLGRLMLRIWRMVTTLSDGSAVWRYLASTWRILVSSTPSMLSSSKNKRS